MRDSILTAIRMYVLTAVVLGLAYPLLVMGVARVAFPQQAEGSLITDADGVIRGSRLIGQEFTSEGYFHGRPSEAGDGYDATASGGSNLGPTSRELAEAVDERVAAAIAREPGLEPGGVPVDMVTASASGLDPHISPANAFAQVARVASARGLSEADVRALVTSQIEARDLGFIGEPRVNVLELNLTLDGFRPARTASAGR